MAEEKGVGGEGNSRREKKGTRVFIKRSKKSSAWDLRFLGTCIFGFLIAIH